jgi:hypothetical protein
MCFNSGVEPVTPPPVVEPPKPPPAPSKVAKALDIAGELQLNPNKTKGVQRLKLQGSGVGVNVPQ